MSNGTAPNLAPGFKIPYLVIATLAGAVLALPPGAQVNVTLGNGAGDAQLVPDAVPQPGSIASGFITNLAAPPPAQAQDSISASVTGATNADGSPVAPSAPVNFSVGAGANPNEIQLVVTLGAPVPA